ncbi:hypothetical protein BG015_009717 [Linnemannia schmuckeri]|uniref:Folliculin n=1 Tax=Linnemannia schmuckeri TaxID=64567 RepID=A0A9P5RV29_9FUNG|nr:hypothetical protein BG015_009717 [Linnemannia schmuckeri]
MNALIALAVWCQPHGPVTILTTQHRRPLSSRINTTTTTSEKNNNNNNSISNTTSRTTDKTDPTIHTHHHHTPRLVVNPSAHPSDDPPSLLLSNSSNNNNGQSNSNHSNSSGGDKSTSTSNSSLDATTAATSTTTTTTTTSATTAPGTLEQKRLRRSLNQPSNPATLSPGGGVNGNGSGNGSGSGSSCSNGNGNGGNGSRSTGPSPSNQPMSSSTNTSSCECQFSIPSGEKSLHSVDPANSELSYISQPVPVDTSLFAPIRIACIRSLNSETYCGREGSVFFGDGVNGYVLSYMFTVFDAQSRGHRVKYTIMTMMTDRVYLVASMEYLISQFQVIASNLQSMANALCPQVQSPAPRSMSYSSSSRRGTIMPENAPTKRGRPLTDVLAKPDIFVQLHAAFVSVLSHCSQRLTERYIQGRPHNECTLLERNQAWETGENSNGENEAQTIESLRELRRVLGRRRFNRLIWNSLVGNQVIIRGEESKIVREVIRSLEDILPKDCCTIIMDGSSYEPSYACNILGLDRSIPIPPDMDPQDFILLDICTESLSQPIPTPPTSLPANHKKSQSDPHTHIYQADWSTTTLVADLKEMATALEKIPVDAKGPNGQQTTESSPRPPNSSPGLLYSPGGGFQAQRRQYLLQAGEEPPEALDMPETEMLVKDVIPPGQGQGQPGLPGGRASPPLKQSHPLYIETVNDILDFRMPRLIEAKRLAVLREEWISKARQFHNLYKSGFASDETVVHRFLQSMGVDQRDLKILRFFTRCARKIL